MFNYVIVNTFVGSDKTIKGIEIYKKRLLTALS